MANYKKKAANAVLLADKMRKSVLQAAIEGKLTTQNPAEDGDARDLLVEIQAEKQRLIETGEIKREKALPAIDQSELPFDIPDNWVWVRLINIFAMQAGKFINASDIKEKGDYPVYGGNGLRGYTNIFNRDGCYPIIGRQGALCGNINMANGKFYATEHAVVVRFYKELNPHWASFFLTSINLNQYATSTAQPGISVEKISSVLIPLPPLAEQQRIVEKLEQILPQLDRLQADENKLHAIQTAFPRRMQASLLQAAIEGKLTTQDPKADGKASDLLKQIQAEKQRLIDAKEIKREKPLPAITEEEKPFDIPDNWEWVRLGEIADYKKGPFGSALTKAMFIPDCENAIKVYEQKHAIQKNYLLGEYFIKKEYYEDKMKGFTVTAGDIIISCAGTIGESYILPDSIRPGIINQALMRVRLNREINKRFYLLAFDYAINSNSAKAKGSAIKNIPPFDILKKLLIPLPPLAEQERIVAKLDALLPKVQALNDL